MEGSRWVPVSQLEGRPHVLVDGASREGTVLCLSHWPGTPTPHRFWADTSTESVLSYLASRRTGRRRLPPEVATDHLDQDGLAAAWALVRPQAALARAGALVALARAGDFLIGEDPGARRASFALAARAGELGSPVGPEAELAHGEELLGLLTELVASGLDTPAIDRLAGPEEAAFVSSEAAAVGGRIVIEEHPAVSLAVVFVAEDLPDVLVSRFLRPAWEPVHPLVVHRRTTADRILLVRGDEIRLSYRYESWVRLGTARVPPRVELSELAERLGSCEPGGVRWVADSVSAPLCSMGPVGGRSELDPTSVARMVSDFLHEATPAWGPDGPSRPASGLSGRAAGPPPARLRWRR